MKRYSWFTLIFVFFVFYCLNCNVFAAKELYDDFSGTYIDSQKWNYREFVREIVAGKLVSKIGNNMFNGKARNKTSFQNPESINAIQCEIEVVETNLDTGNNPISFARIGGFLYNTQAAGGATGDIWAQVLIGDRGSGLEAFWEVSEALDDDLYDWEKKGSGTLIGPDPPDNLKYGTAYTAKLEYVGNNVVKFTVAGVSHSFSGPERQREPMNQHKQLGTGIDADGGSGIGYASASFDNVYINNAASPYDTFDTAPLNPGNWKTLEEVREISDGKLRINAQADGAIKAQSGMLTNYDTSYLEAKVAVKSDSQLSTGALAYTRIDGYFYNDSHGPGSGQDYNGYEGNVQAQTRIMLHDDDSMVATAAVFRIDNPGNYLATRLYDQDFPISINFDSLYTLSIDFTGSAFTFKCNNETLRYSVTTPIYKPYNEGRWLVSRVYADLGETGYMKVDFDDVYTAEAVGFCEGDFENDGDVDGSDLAVFAADFGRTDCSDDCKGDFDFDGDVDGSDLAVFAVDFGRTDCYKIQRHGGVVAYYPFNGNANDESGNGNDGAVNGAGLTTDRSGNENSAYRFDGIDDNIDLGTGLGLVNNAANLTIAAWIYPYEVSPSGTWRQYTILGERNAGDNYQFAVMDNALYFSFWTNGNESMLSGNEGKIEPETWYFVAVTYDGSLVKFYINGELDRTEWASGNIDGHNSTLFLGTWNGTNGIFDGKLDDIKIFNCALTEWEIQQLFNE